MCKVNTLNKATMIHNTMGRKEVVLETYMEDTDNNIIGVKIIKDGNETTNKVLSDCGNHVAVALDVLTGMNLPVGTTFRVMIDFETD
ncbi:MAG: hypothetical protein J6A59_01545 [Lachnospiraceae bacterium]|nr:hypothetical protein [Lachnospiraceae bacterium]